MIFRVLLRISWFSRFPLSFPKLVVSDPSCSGPGPVPRWWTNTRPCHTRTITTGTMHRPHALASRVTGYTAPSQRQSAVRHASLSRVWTPNNPYTPFIGHLPVPLLINTVWIKKLQNRSCKESQFWHFRQNWEITKKSGNLLLFH